MRYREMGNKMRQCLFLRAPLRVCLMFLIMNISLAGCSDVKKTLGLERDPPDEFAVVSRAPLSLPPDFNALPNPEAPKHGHDTTRDVIGAPDKRPQETSPNEKAQKSVFGKDFKETHGKKALTPGEKAFIALINKSLTAQGIQVESLEGGIRSIIDEETHIKTYNEKTWVQKLLFWQKDTHGHKEALNPSEEYHNLYGTLPGEANVTQ